MTPPQIEFVFVKSIVPEIFPQPPGYPEKMRVRMQGEAVMKVIQREFTSRRSIAVVTYHLGRTDTIGNINMHGGIGETYDRIAYFAIRCIDIYEVKMPEIDAHKPHDAIQNVRKTDPKTAG